jgi:uncharacterized protein with FMN-binding domain
MNFIYKIIAGISGAILIVILVAFLIFYLAGVKAENFVGDFQPDISQLQDGRYHGTFSYLGNTKAEIEFEIREGKLVDPQIILLSSTPGYGADYGIKTQINSKKTLNFNAVSGATITSNFARAAIRNAINEGPVK